MAKGILEFDLNEDRHSFMLATKASDMYCVLYSIYNECRHEWKYNEGATDATIALAEKIADMIPEYVLESE